MTKLSTNTDFLTVDEAAALVGLSHWTIRKYAKAGKLQRYVRLSRVVVSRSELLELVKPKPEQKGQAR